MKLDPHLRSIVSIPGLAALLAVPLLAASAAAEDVKLKLLPVGATAKMGGFLPLRLALAAEKPDSIKKLLADLAAPLFGTLKLGTSESPAAFAVVLDEPEGKPSRLFVDANGNGDLTDDPVPVWTSRAVKGGDGKDYTYFSGTAQVSVSFGGEPAAVTIGMYRFDKRDPEHAAQSGFLFHYPDYAREGEVTLGGKTYKALLADRMATGDFRGKEAARSGVQLFLDVNGNDKFDPVGEGFDVRQPFNIAGTTYEIAGLTAGGESFRIEKSTKTVAEQKIMKRKTPELLGVGKPATAFTTKTTDGAALDFPADYKGKIVLLDFWGKWSEPYLGELPGLTAAYQELHPQGFEVLGINHDRTGDAKALADFTKAKEMPWRQVFDAKSGEDSDGSKFWQFDIARLYGVYSIPAAYLVDGDTGMIIANSGLRGEELKNIIKAALAKKREK